MTGLHDALVDALGADAVSVDPADLLAWSHDASPLALRRAISGKAWANASVIVHPTDADDVSRILRLASLHAVPVVAFGGGSGIVGGGLAPEGAIVCSMLRMDDIADVDEASRLVDVGAGVNGTRLESMLARSGWTTGHLPQSLRSGTVGGWIAHRAIGSASTRYGGIEDIVVGLQVVLPNGEILDLPAVPRTSTGPDIRRLFIGGEGRLGIVTRATLRVRARPETTAWQSFAFPEFTAALEVVRSLVQADLRPAVVRCYDATEAQHVAPGMLPNQMALLIVGSEGPAAEVRRLRVEISRHARHRAGEDIGRKPARRWLDRRFDTPGLLASLQAPAGIADALEVSARWRDLPGLYADMRRAMITAIRAEGGTGQVYGHLSHAYPDGGNLYMIVRATAGSSDAVAPMYRSILEAAFRGCISAGGTISHHHGIGRVKAPWLAEEIGPTGMRVLGALIKALDPERILNPGSLVEDDA